MTDLLTVKDVAKILGLSTNTVYKYVNSGVIRSSRAQLQQGRFRVPKKAVEEFLGAPLDEVLDSSASNSTAPQIEQHEAIQATSPSESESATSTPPTEEKYDQLLRSLIHGEHATQATSSDVKSQTAPATTIDTPPIQTQPSASQPRATESKPSFSLKAARLLLLLGLSLYVVNLAYFSSPHPIALFSQLAILFLFIILSYQYGGMRKRVA